MQDFTQVKIRFKDLRSQNAMHEVKFCSVRCKDIRTDDFQRKVKFSSMVFCFVSDVYRAYGDVSRAVKIPFSRILQATHIPTASRRIKTACHHFILVQQDYVHQLFIFAPDLYQSPLL